MKFNFQFNDNGWDTRKGTNISGTNIWYCKVPANVKYVQMLRCNPSDWGQWNYSNGMNVSDRSTNSQNLVTVSGSNYDKAAVAWGSYTPTTKTIHVHVPEGWSSPKLYTWFKDPDNNDQTTNGGWPGTNGDGQNGQSISNTSGNWYDVTITVINPNFIITKDNDTKTNDLTYSGVTGGEYYIAASNSNLTAVTAPTVTSSAASSVSYSSAVFNGNVTSMGNDPDISSYGFYYKNSSFTTANLAGCTQVDLGSKNATGAFTHTATGLSAETTYYFVSYATNHKGTSYGTVRNFTTEAAPVVPTLTLDAVSPTTMVSGNDVTITTTRSNTSNTITFEYTTDDGSHWTSLTPKSTSNSGQTVVWTIPEAHGATQTYKFRAKITADDLTTSKSSGVTVYGKKTIKVKNTNGWATFYSYVYDHNGSATTAKREEWPGSATGVSSAGGQWMQVVLTSQYKYFILNNGSSSSQLSGETYTYASSVSDGLCYEISSGSGSSLTLSSGTCPSAPTSMTTTATPTSSTNVKMTVAGSIGGNGNDNITDYGFYWGTTNACGTQAQVGTSNKTGTISKEITGLTAGTTYYFKSYATNGQGTSYGTVQSYKLPYKVTVSTNTGCSSITKSGTNYTNSTIEVTATKTTGYTFSSWSTTNGTQTSTSSTSTTNTLTFTPTSDNATIQPVYTENQYNETVQVSPAGYGTTDPSAGTVAIKQVTGTSITASPGDDYAFVNWTFSGGGITASDATNKTCTFKATSTSGTITANFTNRFYLKGSGSAMGSWSTENEMPKTATANTYAVTLSLAAKTTYDFKIFNRHTGDAIGASSTTLTRATYSKTGLTTSGGNTYNIHITTDAAGDYTFTYLYNASTSNMKITVTYPTAYTITYGIGDLNGSNSAISATSTPSFSSGDYVLKATAVTFTKGSTKGGYKWKGWYSNTNGTGTCHSSTDANWTSAANTRTGNITVYACYDYATYTATLNQSGTGYGSGGIASVTVTYNTAMPTIAAGNLPTAANGYAFMGYWDAAGGTGTQYYKADGTSAHNWNKTSGANLYAYFKKAEITNLAITNGGVVGPSSTVTVTPTVSPEPNGTVVACWSFLHADNDTPLDPQPTTTPGANRSITFTSPSAGGNYKIVAKLKVDDCTGTQLDADTANLLVASNHTVALQYKCGDSYIYPSGSVDIAALESSSITAPTGDDVFGYSFHHWVLGDGITCTSGTVGDENTKGSTTITIQATYNGKVTAVYRQRGIIYFQKPDDWNGSNDVYYYNIGSAGKWKSSGEGNWGLYTNDITYGACKMTRMGTSNIYYYDYEATAATGDDPSRYVAFANASQNGYQPMTGCQVSWPAEFTQGFDSGTPMFVCANYRHHQWLADYYNAGYWTKYIGGTGYTLTIYNKKENDRTEVKHAAFEPETVGLPFKATVELDGGKTYGFKFCRDNNIWYRNNNDGTMTYNSHTDWPFVYDDGNHYACGLTTTATGNYTFTMTLNSSDGTLRISVDYPISNNDYRLIYKDDAHTNWHPSATIIKRNNDKDIVSFFVRKDKHPVVKIQKATVNGSTGAVTWSDYNGGANLLSSIPSTISDSANYGVYNFNLNLDGSGAMTLEGIDYYKGEFYIRCGALNSKWDSYKTDPDHLMTYSEFSESSANTFGDKYSHYKCKWCPRGTRVNFCIANDYSPCISDTLWQDEGNPFDNIYPENDANRPGELKAEHYDGTTIDTDELNDRFSANIRFMWNRRTNKVSRAYVSSSTNTSRLFLVLQGGATIWNESDVALNDESVSNAAILSDDQNWIYERTIKVTPSTKFKLYACYAQVTPSANGAQYFRGAYDGGSFAKADSTVVLIGGSGSVCKLRVVYDFKTNRLVAAYIPEGTITSELEINADVMLIREHQGDAQQITFSGNKAALKEVKTVYGVMRFNKWTLNNKNSSGQVLPTADQKSIYQRSLYFISFPFNVKLSNVFGFGTYGSQWILEEYDGADRAIKGFWKDSPSFWKFIMPSQLATYELKANQGYILALDLEKMKDDNDTFWAHGITQVELFFPSSASVNNIQQTTVDVNVPSHLCEINRATPDGNRTVKDSHWNVIGVPSYANYSGTVTDDTSTPVTWQTGSSLPYIYEWNMGDNTLTAKSSLGHAYKSMHAYMVQYAGTLRWTLASATPSSIAARHRSNWKSNYEFRLELQKDNTMVDQTYVSLRDDEAVTTNFDFNFDLCKEMNTNKANIYTMVEGYIQTAGNCLPLETEQVTTVPVGVVAKTDGSYTFAMPDGTEGLSVMLYDNQANKYIDLSIEDYTLDLTAGTYDNRFYLTIDPRNSATTIDFVGGEGEDVEAAKIFRNGLLYIQRGDKLYDARGSRIE